MTERPFRPTASALAALTVALAASSAALAAGAKARITRVDGSVVEASSIRVDRGSPDLAARAADREVKLPLDSIVAIQFPARPRKDAGDPGALTLEFLNGDVVSGLPAGGEAEAIEVVSALLGRKRFSVDILKRLLVPSNLDRRDRPSHFARAGNEDVAWVKVSRGRDVVTGTLARFGRDRLSIDTGPPLGTVSFSYAELVALTLVVTSPPPEAKDERVKAVIFGADGSRLTGTLRSISEEGADLEWALGGEFRVPLDRIESIGFESPRFDYVSDLDPFRAVEYPYVGDLGDVLFHWQRDRSVDGNRISLADAIYPKGLGVHSYCELVYDLGGRYSLFSSDLGIDDEVRGIEARGSVVFRVIVDGAVAFESPVVRGGDPVLRIPAIDLKGKRELKLVVDFADSSDAGDRADWAGAFLAR